MERTWRWREFQLFRWHVTRFNTLYAGFKGIPLILYGLRWLRAGTSDHSRKRIARRLINLFAYCRVCRVLSSQSLAN